MLALLMQFEHTCHLDKVWQHQIVTLDFTADLMATGNRSEGHKVIAYCLFMTVLAYHYCVRNSVNSESVTYVRSISIGNKSVPIQSAQCWFPGLAISNARLWIYLSNKIMQYTEAILWNSPQKLLCFEITKMLTAVLKLNLLWHLL